MGRDAENEDAEVAGARAVADLGEQIAGLRGEIARLLDRGPAA